MCQTAQGCEGVVYICMCTTSAYASCTQGLHPRWVQSPDAMNITIPAHPDLARLPGYLLDTYIDGWLTSGKLHPCVLGG